MSATALQATPNKKHAAEDLQLDTPAKRSKLAMLGDAAQAVRANILGVWTQIKGSKVPVATPCGVGVDYDDSGTNESSGMADDAQQAKILLVVGECGDGKSTLINALRDPERSDPAVAGLCGRGITKSITAYVGLPIDGHAVDLLDTPGVGDADVPPMKLLLMIEGELITDEVRSAGQPLRSADAIDGVIVSTPIPDGRVKLGAQLVRLLVEHGFVGEDKWSNVILVGTKADRATQEERDLFTTNDLDENGHPIGIAAQFFAHAPGQVGTYVMTSKDDYSELREAIARLPNRKLQYGTPDPAKMAEAFADKLGVDKEHFQKELVASRSAIEAELNAQFAAREAAMQQEIVRLQQEHQLAVEEQERKTALHAEQLCQEMVKVLADDRRLVEEIRLAGPAERKALERRAAQAQEEIRHMQEKLEQQQRRSQQQLDAKEQQLDVLMRRLEDQAALRARNYSFPTSPALQVASCRHARSRNWGNAHGQGRKCLDCRKELGR